MSTETDHPRAVEQDARVADEQRPAPADARRPFVEPEVSSPVSVLEATTFFQAATSGGTN